MRPLHPPRSRLLVRPLVLVLAAAASGCDSAPGDPSHGPVALRVLPSPAGAQAVSLTLGSRAHLVASPVAADSSVVGAPVAARWQSSDTTAVHVDATGVVTGVRRNAGAEIRASYLSGGRTLTGAMFVVVVAYP
jgi:hypothetical protein